MAEQEPELEEEQDAEEEQEAEEGAEAEEPQSPPQIIMSNLEEKIFDEIDCLFSPATRKRIKARYNIQRNSPSTVASKKRQKFQGGLLVREVRPLPVLKAKQRGGGLSRGRLYEKYCKKKNNVESILVLTCIV